MMPTLRQIERLNRFLLDSYTMGVPPEVIKFSHRGLKPLVIIFLEPIHDIKLTRWFTIDWEGNLVEGS